LLSEALLPGTAIRSRESDLFSSGRIHIQGVSKRDAKRISVCRTKKVMVDWRKLLNKGIHYLVCSPNIIRVSKSRGMRWTGHVT
jgi:hypothetical protein